MRRFDQEVRLVMDHLRQLIFRGELMEGERLVEAELRAEMRASVRAVRHALATLAQEGLIVRRRRLGTFVAANILLHGAAPLPRLQSAGLLSSCPRSAFEPDGYMRRFVTGVQMALKPPARLLFWVPPEDRKFHIDEPPIVDAHTLKQTCKGIIALETCHGSYLNDLVRAGVPVVAVDFAPEGHLFDVLTVDHVAAGRAATRALLTLGHRRIGFLGECASSGSSDPVWQLRLLGYLHAMAEVGGADPCSCICETRRSTEWLRKRLPEFHRARRPSAYVLADGAFFETTRNVLKDLGHSIPKEVSVASADAGTVEALQPGLASARIDYEQVGRASVPMLAARLACPPMPAVRRVLVPTFQSLEGSLASAAK